ncbi:MAG: hypothetical protein JWN07_3275 [Hyphomicrobiales bacterium]|nr:hypothetical protein [Hyphomicrobiales bacterium]
MRAVVHALTLIVAAPWLAAPAHAQQEPPAAPAQTAPAPAKPATPAPVTPPASAQASDDDVRISGTVEKFAGGLISVSPSQGVSLTIRFDAGPGINSMRRGKVSDLKSGAQVTAQAKNNPAGGMMAAQVVIYEPGAETVAGTQASTDPSQVVAKITEIGESNDGPQLSLAYKEGERKLTLAKDAVIWIARPASADDIKPGALITLAGRKPPEGEMKVIRASIGPAGGENPPL